jgi:hypothetical protein
VVNFDVSVWDILTTMQTTSSLFNFLAKFILGEFEILVQLVVLTNVGRFSSWKLQVLGSNENQTKNQIIHNLVITTPKTL